MIKGDVYAPDLARCDATREGSSQDFESTTMIAHALRGEGFDASEDGTGRGTPIVPVCFAIQERAISENLNAGPQGLGVQSDISYTLEARHHAQAVAFSCKDAVAFDLRGREGGAQFEEPHDTANIRAASDGSSRSYVAAPLAFSSKDFGADATSDLSPTLRSMGHDKSHQNGGGQLAIAHQWAVRRLTPRECERLQGFPDDYTRIERAGKPAADGPRYKQLGNSMAVPVIRWICFRIDAELSRPTRGQP